MFEASRLARQKDPLPQKERRKTSQQTIKEPLHKRGSSQQFQEWSH